MQLDVGFLNLCFGDIYRGCLAAEANDSIQVEVMEVSVFVSHGAIIAFASCLKSIWAGHQSINTVIHYNRFNITGYWLD